MREVVWDVETTGLSFEEDRIVEIGCVEIVDILPTGRTFHVYINPQRPVPAQATKIHGLTYDFLKRKPTFARVVDKFLDFIGNAPLVAHNATFDTKMMNAELKRLGRPELANRMVDTLALSREVRKGKGKHTLDAICAEFKIDTTKRTKHGALLDSEILAAAYLELRGGKQHGFSLVVVETKDEYAKPDYGPRPFTSRLTDAEIEAHIAFVETIKNPIWDLYRGGEEERSAA